ncbi:hypothetical protein [Ancylomarina longa]|uniref:Uncharacterized protein n=1 Tax=Ancylomarina longa TaxID=2487017 RepID=A0A434AUK1_9BACT|nr:hypothetical protein [Ancylomarina longa]RUT78023.1 hypothetical protein DLK05_10265 [Ancylomarina longa]
MSIEELKKHVVSSDGQNFGKSTVEEAVLALNLELGKYPRGEVIEGIQFKISENNGVFKAECEYYTKK